MPWDPRQKVTLGGPPKPRTHPAILVNGMIPLPREKILAKAEQIISPPAPQPAEVRQILGGNRKKTFKRKRPRKKMKSKKRRKSKRNKVKKY